jgi:hypothetical protein
MWRLNFIVSLGALSAAMVTLVLTATGCFAPLIPLAIQGAGMAVQMVGVTAQAGTMVKHGQDPNADETENNEETAFDDSDFDSSSSKNAANEGKCNELELITPSIIEFRTDHEGVTQWRELGLGGSPDSPRWTVVAEATAAVEKAKDLAPGGWAPASNLGHMDFNPPLKTSVVPGYTIFLAYAPESSLIAIERDQLASLNLDFGPVAGTFEYNERIFKYATLKMLPCFPVAQ